MRRLSLLGIGETRDVFGARARARRAIGEKDRSIAEKFSEIAWWNIYSL
jgi:hypothetical protein